ncbi:MAG: hypothetical protein MZV64_69085 [Ignavibacteriales bacterium]|nr:hypothetical protein [Ignavibacteriales bacterium]
MIEDNVLFIKTVIALWNLGAVPVPFNTKLLDDEINSILDDYDFKYLITDSTINFGARYKSLSLADKRKEI